MEKKLNYILSEFFGTVKIQYMKFITNLRVKKSWNGNFRMGYNANFADDDPERDSFQLFLENLFSKFCICSNRNRFSEINF
jgi:hypothetical protein